MLKRELLLVPGDVLDTQGQVVGRHEGTPAYTLGQRHGFVLFASSPHTAPHYVVGKDLEFNTITVSPDKFPPGAGVTEIKLSDTNWIGEVPQGALEARYRYRGELIAAECDKANAKVTLQKPQYVPEGQSLVLYSDERCLGGGIIEQAWLSSLPNQTAPSSPSTSANLSPRLSARAPSPR
jgi:tRNA-specific 2-thiouridylase